MADSWKFIAGRICLDFVNTVGGWDRAGNVLRDKLESESDLVAWARRAGVPVSKAGSTAPSDALVRAKKLRAALHAIFQSVALGRRTNDRQLKILQAELSTAQTNERLARSGSGFAFVWDDAKSPADTVLWTIAKSAAELLTSDDLAKIRQCGGNECGWLFLDTSRNHSRRWCDMRDCGNLAKVKRFRQRRRQQ